MHPNICIYIYIYITLTDINILIIQLAVYLYLDNVSFFCSNRFYFGQLIIVY